MQDVYKDKSLTPLFSKILFFPLLCSPRGIFLIHIALAIIFPNSYNTGSCSDSFKPGRYLFKECQQLFILFHTAPIIFSQSQCSDNYIFHLYNLGSYFFFSFWNHGNYIFSHQCNLAIFVFIHTTLIIALSLIHTLVIVTFTPSC